MCKLFNLHDKFFKRTFEDISTARDFITCYFPDELKQKIDLKDMKLVQTETVTKLLEKNQSDLIYNIRYNNKEAYLYFLFEHKSYISRNISLQLLKYITALWELMCQQKKKSNKEKNKLAVIIPLVFYHGRKKWDVGLNLSDLLEEYEEDIAEHIPDFKYILYDFSPYRKQEIRGHVKLRLFLELIRYVNTEEMLKRFDDFLYLMKKIKQTEDGIEYIKTALEYLVNVDEKINYDTFVGKSKMIIPERSEDILTIADQLRKEGLEKGIEKGRKSVAITMLKEGMNIEEIAKFTKLDKKEIELMKKEIKH